MGRPYIGWIRPPSNKIDRNRRLLATGRYVDEKGWESGFDLDRIKAEIAAKPPHCPESFEAVFGYYENWEMAVDQELNISQEKTSMLNKLQSSHHPLSAAAADATSDNPSAGEPVRRKKRKATHAPKGVKDRVAGDADGEPRKRARTRVEKKTVKFDRLP